MNYSQIKIINIISGDRWSISHGGITDDGSGDIHTSKYYNLVEKGEYIAGTDNFGLSSYTDFEVSFPNPLNVEEICDVYLTNFTVTAPRSANSYYDINSNNKEKFGYSTVNPFTQEVQTVTTGAGADDLGGTFTLSFGGGTTTDLVKDISASAMATALNALSTISGATVTRGSKTGNGYVYTVTFAPGTGNVAMITCDTTDLTGTSPTCAVAQTTAGVASALENFNPITLEEGIFTLPITTAINGFERPGYSINNVDGNYDYDIIYLNFRGPERSVQGTQQLQGSVLDQEGVLYHNAGKLNQVHGGSGAGAKNRGVMSLLDNLSFSMRDRNKLRIDLTVNALTVDNSAKTFTFASAPGFGDKDASDILGLTDFYAPADKIYFKGLTAGADNASSDVNGGKSFTITAVTSTVITVSVAPTAQSSTTSGILFLFGNNPYPFSKPLVLGHQYHGTEILATPNPRTDADTLYWKPIPFNNDDNVGANPSMIVAAVIITHGSEGILTSSSTSIYGSDFNIIDAVGDDLLNYKIGDILVIQSEQGAGFNEDGNALTSGDTYFENTEPFIESPQSADANIWLFVVGADCVKYNGACTAASPDAYNMPWTNKFSFRGWKQPDGSEGVFYRTNGNTEYDKQIARYVGMKYYSTGGYWFIGAGVGAAADIPAVSTSSVIAPNDTLPDILPGSQYFLLNIEDSRGLLKTKSYSNIRATNSEYSGIFRTKGHSIDGDGSILIPNDVPIGYNPGNHSFTSNKAIYVGEIGKTKIDKLNIKLTCAPGNKDPSIFIASGGSAFTERNNIFMQLLFVPKGMDIENSNIF